MIPILFVFCYIPADLLLHNGSTMIFRSIPYWHLNSSRVVSFLTHRDLPIRLDLAQTSCSDSSFSVIRPSPFLFYFPYNRVVLQKAFYRLTSWGKIAFTWSVSELDLMVAAMIMPKLSTKLQLLYINYFSLPFFCT